MAKVLNPDLIFIADKIIFCALKTDLSRFYCVQNYIFFLFRLKTHLKNNKKAVFSFPQNKEVIGMHHKILSILFFLSLSVASVASDSVLSTGNWYKMGVPETGVYKLTYSDLASLGVDVDYVDPRDFRLFHNGGGVLGELNSQPRFNDLVEIPVVVNGESDGRFDSGDYILFYARGPVTWNYVATPESFQHRPNDYDDYAYVFLTADLGRGKRIQTALQPSATIDETVTEFLDYQVYDKDSYNIISGGRTYYGDIVDGNSELALNFDFPHAKLNRPCLISVDLAGRNFSPASFQVYAGNTLLKSFPITTTSSSSQKPFAYPVSGSMTTSMSGDRLTVRLKHVGVAGTTSIGYVNYVSVNAWRSLTFVGPEMLFRNPLAFDDSKVFRYQLSDATSAVQVWEVSEPTNPMRVSGQLTGNVYSFNARGAAESEFVAFDGSSYHNPMLIGEVANQNLHDDLGYDYLMVVYPDFLAQAERLKAIHAVYDPDLNIKIVTPEQIYNEFSCGAVDVSAIRDYCRLLYQHSRPLRYLLLFGDASFDYKNRNGVVNFVPTYEAIASTSILSSIVTDDFFCFMDDEEGALTNSTPDIGAGRFPVSTVEQAEQMVTKVEHYLALNESTMRPWRNVITFMCDDAEGNEFFENSEYFARQIKTTGGERMVIDKIYLDAYNQESTPSGQAAPEVNQTLNNRMEKGTLVLNYMGHGGEVQLTDERILQRADVSSWRNGPQYPLMITGTCEFSRYDDHGRTSLGEYAFLNQYGGMVAMFTTSRVTIGINNKSFVSSVYDHLFEIENGKRIRLGDVFRQAKHRGKSWERQYVFFGDPALRLPLPIWTVETTAIADTLKALQPVTIEGVVKDDHGSVASSFNGVVYVSVYDKETTYTTKGDEDTDPREFQLRHSILFNGKTEVVNGHFSIDFIVPRDISYRYGGGMVSYYATDYQHDASGLFEDFVIGGFYEDAVQDEQSPVVQLYIDDEMFVSGGITGNSPTLIAYVEDASGINTTGAGIGHDIVATLTGPSNGYYVLNDYFTSDLGSQGRGTIVYRMSNLEEGDYILTLKVWDIYNNSGVSSIAFRVTDSQLMALEDPLCFPNPVAGEAWFSFGHNQVGNNMDVQIRIYDITGRLVTIVNDQVQGTSARVNPIYWNGCASNGSKLKAGLYIYSIYATNDQGESATITSKFIVTQ